MILVKTKDDRRRMLVILNHARPFEGNFQINYDLRKDENNLKIFQQIIQIIILIVQKIVLV